MLPGFDGLEVCRRIQAVRATPVLMLTARSDETDMLIGLGIGADDYLTKPFSMRELVARVRVLLRRMDRVPDQQSVSVGGCRIDMEARRVHLGEDEVHLTRTEFDLLAFLVARPGAAVARETLLEHIWGPPIRCREPHRGQPRQSVAAQAGFGADPHRARCRLRVGDAAVKSRLTASLGPAAAALGSLRLLQGQDGSARRRRDHPGRVHVLDRRGLADPLHAARRAGRLTRAHPVPRPRHDVTAASDDRRGARHGPRRLQRARPRHL